jgi:AcrR family transcriptional regulator
VASRTVSLTRRISRLPAEPNRREAIALGLVDALLERDGETLGAALDAMRDTHARTDGDEELAGWLDAAIAFAHWGLERTPSPVAVAQGTQAHDFLSVLDGSAQMGSAELRRALETDETQVSRTGRRLLESGLVARSKAGRQVFWQLTPRGREALAQVPASRRIPEFWQDALRRGFDGERGEVDPTRERIVESALELHVTKGIRATTWPDVADRAGLPVQTVREHFPTVEDLEMSCGQHIAESLRLPPSDRAAEVYADTPSEQERIHRLVETVFDVYERGADGIAAGRRERTEVPAANGLMQALDTTLDALVVEAVRPYRPDTSSVASLRALTDLEVWRALRHQGATPEAAVDEASAAVERWLATRA